MAFGLSPLARWTDHAEENVRACHSAMANAAVTPPAGAAAPVPDADRLPAASSFHPKTPSADHAFDSSPPRMASARVLHNVKVDRYSALALQIVKVDRYSALVLKIVKVDRYCCSW